MPNTQLIKKDSGNQYVPEKCYLLSRYKKKKNVIVILFLNNVLSQKN